MRIGWLAAAAVILGAALVPGVLRADEAEQAPDFKLTNLDGQEVELSKLRGSVVVLDFFATWCGPCRRALPYAQKLSQSEAAKSKDLVVMAVNV
ncbi:MAG: TlpA family protein disulfide reductase, partial [Armatimonadetes bacterium]|nr:TlpA family protein disulfide reductase [Armatimonadota bacterium]